MPPRERATVIVPSPSSIHPSVHLSVRPFLRPYICRHPALPPPPAYSHLRPSSFSPSSPPSLCPSLCPCPSPSPRPAPAPAPPAMAATISHAAGTWSMHRHTSPPSPPSRHPAVSRSSPHASTGTTSRASRPPAPIPEGRRQHDPYYGFSRMSLHARPACRPSVPSAPARAC